MKKIEELNKDVESMEKELAEAKKTLRELRTKGLREAMEAKKLEQKQLQARFIPSKDQEQEYVNMFTSKPWMTQERILSPLEEELL